MGGLTILKIMMIPLFFFENRNCNNSSRNALLLGDCTILADNRNEIKIKQFSLNREYFRFRTKALTLEKKKSIKDNLLRK